jgi:hypothetical protein
MLREYERGERTSQNKGKKMDAPIELRSMAPHVHVARGSSYAKLLVWATRVCALSLILNWLLTDMVTELASLAFKLSDPVWAGMRFENISNDLKCILFEKYGFFIPKKPNSCVPVV